ncbi:MAG: PAS domain S-box protein [Phycisphaerae bacterium]|nr:PAS domain S-box protein [Phycisphaerae bacterium]
MGSSDRRQTQQAEERHLLTHIIAHIPSGVFWKDRDFRYLGCNEAFARSAGVARPDDIVGKTDYELAWEKEQADYFRTCDRRVMEEDRPLLNIEEVERQADGRQAILLTSKVPLHAADGQVCGVLGIDTDISELKRVEAELRQIRSELESRVRERTADLARANETLQGEVAERKRAEEALRVSQEQYRLVSELTSDYAYAFHADADGFCRVEWVTGAFTRITGHDASQLAGRGGWTQIVHPDDLPVVERRGQGLFAGRTMVTEFRIVGRDGRIWWLRDHARPIWHEAEHRTVRILGAAQDITERKQAEEESQRHQAALAHVARLSTMGELSAQLAHELNQPLCTIVGNAQTAQRLLSSASLDREELREALGDIVSAGKHAGEVIRRLRAFLREQQPQFVMLNVERVVEEVADFIEADARQHGRRVRFAVAPDLPVVRGDPIQLQQVLLNLVRNGLEAMREASEAAGELIVHVRRRDESNEVVIGVSDTGAGLPGENTETIFEPFFTTKAAGLGLGLSISRSIVEAHGGRLWAESNEGPGATFLFTVPAIRKGDE